MFGIYLTPSVLERRCVIHYLVFSLNFTAYRILLFAFVARFAAIHNVLNWSILRLTLASLFEIWVINHSTEAMSWICLEGIFTATIS